MFGFYISKAVCILRRKKKFFTLTIIIRSPITNDVISNRKINLSRKLLLSFPETQQPSNAEPATFNDSAFFMMKVMKVTFYKCSGTFLWNRFIVFFKTSDCNGQ